MLREREQINGRRTQPKPNQPIAFARRLAGSEVFRAHVQGRHGAGRGNGQLSRWRRPDRVRAVCRRSASLRYATESMRLTTRLMQLASWLLLQRAVNDGEMSAEQAQPRKGQGQARRPGDGDGGAELGRTAGTAPVADRALAAACGSGSATSNGPRQPGQARRLGATIRSPGRSARSPGLSAPSPNSRHPQRLPNEKGPSRRALDRFSPWRAVGQLPISPL